MTNITVSNLKKLKTELAQLDARRGKIIAQLKESDEFLMSRLKERIPLIKNQYFFDRKNPDKIFQITEIKISIDKNKNKEYFFEIWKKTSSTNPVKINVLSRIPFEYESIDNMLSLGMKKAPESQLKAIRKKELEESILKMENDLKALKAEKAKLK